jgi:hypothetical protein
MIKVIFHQYPKIISRLQFDSWRSSIKKLLFQHKIKNNMNNYFKSLISFVTFKSKNTVCRIKWHYV